MLFKRRLVLGLFEIGMEFMNLILLVGFSNFNGNNTPTGEHVGLILIAFGEPLTFIIGWSTPRTGSALLACLNALTLILIAMPSLAADLRSGLIISAGVFWIAKFTLAWLMHSLGNSRILDRTVGANPEA
ncbi:MAG: hypothetical protein NVSMB52_21330 [Chloroflexota bacterium]